MSRLSALVRSWFRFDLTTEDLKTETRKRLNDQTERLSALETIRPAYHTVGARLTERRSSKR